MESEAAGRYALTPVMTTKFGLEFSVHTLPRQFKSELEAIFPGVDVSDMLLVPTCQKSAEDLVGVGDAVDVEKDKLLEQFAAWAAAICKKLEEQGLWADYIDPCSGLPMIHKGTNTIYSEVDALASLLNYSVANAGCCKVVLHPKWGSSAYPASLLTKAPLEALKAAIAEVEAPACCAGGSCC